MTTLIIARKTDGSSLGQCDAKCYNARGPKCTCVCRGINHGAGYNQAIENTHNHTHTLRDLKAPGKLIINPAQYQLFLGGKP